MNDRQTSVSVTVPARNEAQGVRWLLPLLDSICPHAEIVVVDDGSTDETKSVAQSHCAMLITHAYNMGNGAAIKSGARRATGDVIIFMDADGQHPPEDIPRLLARLDEGYDMVVGARTAGTHATATRALGNRLYNRLASWMTGQRIEDLTSGFRAVRRERFMEFLHMLPNGFSYPTTITMAFMRSGYPVAYVPIAARPRQGRSHLNLFRDGVRFLLIIFKVACFYSPMKLFAPTSLVFFALGLGHYAYTYVTAGRFTNMSALLLTTSVLVFLLGLVSEQITNLLYALRPDHPERDR